MIGPYTIKYLTTQDYDLVPVLHKRRFAIKNALGTILTGSHLIPMVIRGMPYDTFADTSPIEQLKNAARKLQQVTRVIADHHDALFDGLDSSDGQLWAVRFLDFVRLVTPHLGTMEELIGQLQVVENSEGVTLSPDDSKKQWEHMINLVCIIKGNFPHLRVVCSDGGFESEISEAFPQRLAQDIVRQGAEGQDLSRLYLAGCNLSGSNLKDATLKGINLHQTNLSQANLSGADLQGADLYGANLQGTNLSRANLSQANLNEADLREANLLGANLRNTALYGTKIDNTTRLDEKWQLG